MCRPCRLAGCCARCATRQQLAMPDTLQALPAVVHTDMTPQPLPIAAHGPCTELPKRPMRLKVMAAAQLLHLHLLRACSPCPHKHPTT